MKVMDVAKFLIFGFGLGLVLATEETSHVIHKRIINGVPAEISAIPYQVSLTNKNGHFYCGGSVISRTFILTAAHCVEEICLACDKVKVRIGSSYFDKEGMVINVKNIHMHPKYIPNDETCRYDCDVAVLELETSIPNYITAKAIPLAETEPKGQAVVQISGWGLTEPVTRYKKYYKASTTLQAVNATVIHRTLCEKMTNYFPFAGCPERPEFTSRMICVEGDERGVCKGDSGGPVIFNNTQVGIVSWGWTTFEGQCTSSPSVMVNIADPEIRNFITEKAKLNR